MAKLNELKIMFKTGDITAAEIDLCQNGQYTLFFFSRSGNEWIALETQRTGNSVDDIRYFKTIDAAVSVAQSIGFEAVKLAIKA